MNETGLTNDAGRPTKGDMKRLMTLALIGASVLCSACVNVTAPDKPIVINLNIKITQEVVFKLDSKAKSLIQSNPEIF
ncbi:MAG: YnbE family lipoprotein [Sphingomonas sp.]|nr:YnbE family lipoprotein [Sphingomonas sp.]